MRPQKISKTKTKIKMVKEQGKFPPEGSICLESTKEQWLLFEKRILNSFSTFGIVEDPTNKRRLKIEIDFKIVISPENNNLNVSTVRHFSNLDNVKASGIDRATDFFVNMANRDIWIIFGNIVGENEIPITIIYYEQFGLAVYAQKLIGEELNGFLPPNSYGLFSNN